MILILWFLGTCRPCTHIQQTHICCINTCTGNVDARDSWGWPDPDPTCPTHHKDTHIHSHTYIYIYVCIQLLVLSCTYLQTIEADLLHTTWGSAPLLSKKTDKSDASFLTYFLFTVPGIKRNIFNKYISSRTINLLFYCRMEQFSPQKCLPGGGCGRMETGSEIVWFNLISQFYLLKLCIQLQV